EQGDEGNFAFDHQRSRTPDSEPGQRHGSDSGPPRAHQDDPSAHGVFLGENNPVLSLEDLDISDMANGSHIDDLKLTTSFIRALREATLDDPGMKLDGDALNRLRNPPRERLDVNNAEFLFSLKTF